MNSLFKDNKKIFRASTLIIFLLIYLFLIKQIPWRLVFSNTFASGGDTGTHNYLAFYASKIFPKIKWWSPDWTAGFPFLYFYPPLFFYLISFFVRFASLPATILFKLATLAGTFLFPLSLFLCLKILDFKFPIPEVGALFSLFYLFLEKFSIYGGNLPSTLAGEFSFSFSFSLFFIFIALLVKAQEEKKYSLLTILVLSLLVLSHPIPVIISVLFALIMFLEKIIFEKKTKETFVYLSKIFGIAFCLTGFWSLPFLVFHLEGYTAKMQWYKTIVLNEIFPITLWPIFIFLITGILYFILKFKKENKNLLWFFLIIIVSLIPYLGLNKSSIFNCRFLPFIIVSYILIASYGFGSFLNFVFNRIQVNYQTLIKCAFLIISSSFLIYFYLPKTISYLPFWLKWNYEGFENKTTWSSISPLFVYLKSLPYGRVMVEYRPEYDKFGTPRIFENLPIFADKPTFEGLLTESSVNSYFHFINQTETTHKPSAAIAGFEYPPFNFENGIKHLRLFGARYFIAFTPEIKEQASQYLKKLKEINEFTVYEIENSPLVELVSEIDLQPKTRKWLDKSISWYKGMNFERPIVFYQNHKEFQTIKNSLKKTEPRESSVEVISISDDSLTFTTQNLGQPHLVKISYFPGWKVAGAKGPFLISPSFMMVIPFQNEVTLKYGYNFWDKVGFTLSLISIVYLISKWIIGGLIGFLKRRKLSRFQSN